MGMIKPYTFRQAEVEDIPCVMAFLPQFYGTPGCTWRPEYPSPEDITHDVAVGGLYLLLEGSELISVGYAGPSDELDMLSWTPKHPCELARFCVRRDLQGRGIGALMLKRLMAIARAQESYDGLCLLAHHENPAAHALYEKHGFTKLCEADLFDNLWYAYELVF